jgi:dihydrodipicolinate synthase/N-acetylneuraminate lyase
MKRADADLDRLLRSAAKAVDPSTPEVPYGFETRVIALWQAGHGRADDAVELARFLSRVGAVALVVLALASISTYQQFNENEARTTPQANEYALADSAIQTEFSQ